MLQRIWDRLATPIRQRGAAVFLTLAVIVGAVVGVAAAALIGAVELMGDSLAWFGDRIGNERIAILIALPPKAPLFYLFESSVRSRVVSKTQP